MKRKSEVLQQIEPKIPALSPFLKEEILDVNDIDKDVDDFLDCYNKFVKYVTEVYDKKEKTSAATAAHFILKFKELNRKAQFRLSISREKTKETKDAINKSHLTMQNLLYEALHLEKETNSCLEYKSLFEEIDLVSIDQFKEQAPLSLQNTTSEHELTLNRLHWELCERKSLSTQIEEAEKAEQRLLEEINKKNQSYANISTHLRSVLDSTQSLEDIFDIPMHVQESQNNLAEILPEQLYVLYTHMRVHAIIEQHNMRVTIVNDSEQMYVHVELSMDGGVQLSLLFQWDDALSLITVLPRLDGSVLSSLSVLTKPLLDSSFILSELPGDHGLPFTSPWIRAKVLDSSTLVNSHRGLPYLWCQRLSGTFTDASVNDHRTVGSAPTDEYTEVCVGSRIPESRPLAQIIGDIRHRVVARVELVKEINALSTMVTNHITMEWCSSTFAAFKAAQSDTAVFVGSGLASEQCFYYMLNVRSVKYSSDGPVSLWLVVPHSYPDNHCLIVFSKLGQSVALTDSNQQYRQAMHLVEVEVNCYCDELVTTNRVGLISAQFLRLANALETLFEYRHCGSKSSLGQLFIGGKFPRTKRPFKSL